MNDLISVIVPVFNVASYIDRCIVSIIEQQNVNMEIILVDDGSTDGCGEKCDEYAKKDKRIRVIHKKNEGLSSARNVGLGCARGEYIFFLDGDDYLAEDALLNMYACLNETDSDICEGVIKAVDDSGCGFTVSKKISYKVFNKNDALESLMYLNDFTNSACAKLFRKNTIGEIRFPEKKLYEDLATTYKFFFNANKSVKLDQIVYYYYQNNDSIMHKQYSSKRLTAIDFASEQLDYCRSHEQELISAAEYRLTYECIRVLNEMPFFCKDSRRVFNILRKYRASVLGDKKLSFRKKVLLFSSFFGKIGIKVMNLFRKG